MTELVYEESLLVNPYSAKTWISYIESVNNLDNRIILYERALHSLPYSYKIWRMYIQQQIIPLADEHNEQYYSSFKDKEYAINKIIILYDRCLIHCLKFPKIWLEYIQFLMTYASDRITLIRNILNNSLRSLPLTQHLQWVWPQFLLFAKSTFIPMQTSIRIWKRYLKVFPDKIEDYVVFLTDKHEYNEAITVLCYICNNDEFRSIYNKSKYDLWKELLLLITNHSSSIKSINVENIIRSGINRFASEIGILYISLSDYYIRLGHFDRARDIYEEGLSKVTTVRDFTLIFDAYTQYEESLLSAKMELYEEISTQQQENSNDMNEIQLDIDLRLARLQYLLEKRPLLLNDVLLKQNPNDVNEWLTRIRLFKNDPIKQVSEYTKAIMTIDPKICTGKLHFIWINFAVHYSKYNDIDNCRLIFNKATKVEYNNVDSLCSVWCAYVEMELGHNNYKEALELLRTCLIVPTNYQNDHQNNRNKLYRSTRLWSLYADLEESFGTLETTKSIYEQMITLKIVTPTIILNYAKFMHENNYFEQSYHIYEHGVSLFVYPQIYPIYIMYIKSLILRYKNNKVERIRDLFEQALGDIPKEKCFKIYLLYAKYEEDYGLCRRAMNIYDRACSSVSLSERIKMYKIYLNRCTEFYGPVKTREIYNKALEVLPNNDILCIGIQYANMEYKLGEIDRCRAIYVYISQYSNPLKDVDFWKQWNDFEINLGNPDTFREMIRIRRSIETSNISDPSSINIPEAHLEAMNHMKKPLRDIDALEAQIKQKNDMIMNETNGDDDNGELLYNEDEIDIDDDFDIATNVPDSIYS